MAKAFKFRDLFLGKEIIASKGQFKRLMLTGYLSLICMVVALIYTLLDAFHQLYHSFIAYAVLFFIPMVSIFLLRAKKFKAAKIVLLLSSNLVVFWSALHDPLETGVFMFFIPAGIGSFVILAFADYKTGIALACFSAFLFLVAYFGDLRFFKAAMPSALYVQISFVLNYFISLAISILSVYFLMNLNRLSEKELIQKENLARQKNMELQKVNEELDRFVYSVSHDLRSPLSSILGLTQIARLTNDPEELDQILIMIQGRVDAQDHFIREIIDYSRNERTETEAGPVNLKQLVNEVIDSLKFDFNADKIEFRQLIKDDTILLSDKIRLRIILSNLIGNAVKHHDFTKENPFIEIGYREDLSMLYVRDNGTGIRPEYQGKIFDMFYRGSDRSKGSGLGLFITKETVKKISGTIELKSVYGEGSTFFVYLDGTTK